jgi:predicted PurR-regulated permease PerM
MDRSPLATGPIVWLGIIATTCLLLLVFQSALWLVVPVFLAVIFYYLLSPAVRWSMGRGLSRSRSVAAVTVVLWTVIGLVCLLSAPKASRAVHNWPARFGDYVKGGADLLVSAQKTVTTHVPMLSRAWMSVSPDDMEKQAADWAAHNSGGIALQLLHWIPSLLLVPYLTYFFLLDGPRFKRFVVQAIPNAFFEKALYLFYRMEDQLRRYFQGLLTLTALDATCLGIGLWAIGLHSPFILAGAAAVLAWLPYLGSIAGCLMVVLVTKHDAPEAVWLPYWAIGLFILVRLLDDFVFMPATVGRSLQMHPLVTVMMILLGGAVAGISGLLLVMPVLGVVMVAGQIIGELLTDARVLARHRHAKELRRLRARTDL